MWVAVTNGSHKISVAKTMDSFKVISPSSKRSAAERLKRCLPTRNNWRWSDWVGGQGTGWGGVRWDGVEWDGMGWDGMGLGGMGWGFKWA